MLNSLLIQELLNSSIGKRVGSNGDRYDGEWKDDKMHGYGNKSDLLNNVLVLSFLNDSQTDTLYSHFGDR